MKGGVVMANSNSLGYCAREKKPCVEWVERYLKDCLCNLRDEASFGLGMVSLVCWGVAEIPQIVTNFRTKSSHGVSLAFLLAWVAGDAFNLIGCFLEPATLPTQFYTALLYTISTLVLVLQTLYYDRIRVWWKHRDMIESDHRVEDEKVALVCKSADSSPAAPRTITTSPLNAFSRNSNFYYTSARSLAGSSTPPFRSYLVTNAARSGPSALQGVERDDTSDDDDDNVAAVSSNPGMSPSQPRPIPRPRSAGYGAFIATTASLPLQGKSLMEARVGFTGRKLLLNEQGPEHSLYGQWLGWLMAAIYMGGRIPQIFLNIKRGSVEGLNPLMFVFALIANVAYVGSILVRTLEWEKIKANMPWLLDAVVCVLLDFLIIMQYIYYKCIRRSNRRDEASHDYYEEGNKA